MFPISEIIVAIEKKPNTRAVTAEKSKAKMFLYFSWRTTDTTANNATSKQIRANIR